MSDVKQIQCGGVLYDILDANTLSLVCEIVENGTTASQTLEKGTIILRNGKMYKVTTTIASGGSFNVGVNIVETDIGEELTQINASLSNNYICIGQKLLTLATGNGTKTVAQLLNEAFTTLSAYSPSSDEATHFIVESANIPMGEASVLKSCLCFDRNLYATFDFSLIDFGINAVRANNISLYGARMQTSGSLFTRTNFTSRASTRSLYQ